MNLFKHIKHRLLDTTETIRNCYEDGKEDTELAKISTFIQCGLFILSVILISGIAIAYGQGRLREESVTTSVNTNSVETAAQGYTKSQKKLPIYCVDTDEKKVGLSFDAAWGARRLLNMTSSAKT